MGLSDGLLRWFKSYLSHRRQRVVLNGVESNWADVLAGVPQGSILGPLLFLIYINDIVNNIRSSIRLFADDTTIYIIIDNPQTAAFILNTDLETINGWSHDWSTSVASFKYQLNKDTQRRAPPKLFSVGSRLGQILHARIRMACSSLNSDLYRKNIVPSPSCACGGFESAYHFFFICPKYNATRE